MWEVREEITGGASSPRPPEAIIRLPFDNLTLPRDTLQCVSRFRYSQYPLKTVSTLTVTFTEFCPVHVKMKHPNVVLPLTPPVVE